MQRTKAFTLIELLVVISIIALLIAILLPALRSAREAGHKVNCMSNLKNIGVAVSLYQDDFERYYPNGTWQGGGYTDHILLLAPYGIHARTGIYKCPSAESFLDATEALVQSQILLGSGWTLEHHVGQYSTVYNNFLGYWNGTQWNPERRRDTDFYNKMVVMHCANTSPTSFDVWSWGMSAYKPGGTLYDVFGFSLPHGEDANVLWSDATVTAAGENKDVPDSSFYRFE